MAYSKILETVLENKLERLVAMIVNMTAVNINFGG